MYTKAFYSENRTRFAENVTFFKDIKPKALYEVYVDTPFGLDSEVPLVMHRQGFFLQSDGYLLVTNKSLYYNWGLGLQEGSQGPISLDQIRQVEVKSEFLGQRASLTVNNRPLGDDLTIDKKKNAKALHDYLTPLAKYKWATEQETAFPQPSTSLEKVESDITTRLKQVRDLLDQGSIDRS
jgi:hypothetical protein